MYNECIFKVFTFNSVEIFEWNHDTNRQSSAANIMMVIKCPKHNLQHDLWETRENCFAMKRRWSSTPQRMATLGFYSVWFSATLQFGIGNNNVFWRCLRFSVEICLKYVYVQWNCIYFTYVFEQNVRKSENRWKIYSQTILYKPGNSHKTNTTQIIRRRCMVVNFILSDWQADMPSPCAFVLQHQNVIALCSDS